MTKVCGPRYVQHLGTQPRGLRSRHGDLAAPGSWGGPFHSVVIVGRTDSGFELLDPYYPAGGQPIGIDDDAMLDVYACELVVAGRVP